MHTLLVGQGGREAAIAQKLSRECKLSVFMGHANPSLVREAQRSGGEVGIGSVVSPKEVAAFAKKCGAELAVVSADNPLEAGVVDALLESGIPSVGPTRAGAEIEWNKAFARELVREVAPEFAPQFWIGRSEAELKKIISEAEASRMEIVVKPAGLTGGKGVKVMGEHLKDFAEALEYAVSVLRAPGDGGRDVVIEEKLEGVEFTLQGLTDGVSVVRTPLTYDYPYRFEGDTGPGTGGMGSVSWENKTPPFVKAEQYEKCVAVAEQILRALKDRKRHFNGVMNVGFFYTPRGLKIMEFNARFGDPECINIMSLLNSSALELFTGIAKGELDPSTVRLAKAASVNKYLVAPEYCLGGKKEHRFTVDVEGLEADGAQVLFSAAVQDGSVPNTFKTTGASRNVAISVTAPTAPEASLRIEALLSRYVTGPLEHRADIGSKKYIDSLVQRTRSYP